jgi:hypothetical protein
MSLKIGKQKKKKKNTANFFKKKDLKKKQKLTRTNPSDLLSRSWDWGYSIKANLKK